MTYLKDKIMYLIIVLLRLKIKKLTIDDLPEPPKYEDVLGYSQTNLTLKDLEDPPQYKEIISLNQINLYLQLNKLLSKKAELKRIFFSIVFIFMIYFLFFSIIPGQEKLFIKVYAADDDVCTDSAASQNPDANSTQCTAYGCYEIGNEATCCPPNADPNNNATYDAGLYYDTGTQGSCCGDDSNEYYEECSATGSISWSGSCSAGDRACCTGANSCIDLNSAICYSNATSYNITGQSSGNDQYARCTAGGQWYDCDSDSGTCASCANLGDWSQTTCSGSNCFVYSGESSVGEYPDTSTLQCCGDDANENAIIEYNAIDTPSPYNNNNTGTTCCNSPTDCSETGTDTCTSQGSTAGSIPSEAYCGSNNIWYGGDDSEIACNAIVGGSNNWDIGGEALSSPNDLCCGDDPTENKTYQQVDPGGSMDAGYSDEPSDNACCFSISDCVNESTCYNSGSSTTASVDQDSDTDYCSNGEWYDCQDDSDCTGGQQTVCNIYKDCVNSDGYIYIRNIGVTGIENVSHDYTSIRTVLLELNFTDDYVACRYIDGIDADTQPNPNDPDWTSWEPCVRSRIWSLTEGTGEKTVYFQINYSAPTQHLSLFNDSIIYNYTGVGLDKTPPNPAIIILDGYINSNQTVPISWYNASDPESDVLDIPLRYEYKVFNNTDTLTIGTTTSISVNADISSYNFPSNTTLYVNVTVINSAGLTATDGPETTKIDLEPPYVVLNPALQYFQNLTTNDYQSFSGINEDTYVAASTVNLTWVGYDDITINVDAYSYILTQNPNTNPDNVPEGSIGSFDSETYKKYSNLDSGKYYFKVKARDLAGNWGTINSINFSIDSTAPSKPNIKDESRTAGNLTITWYASSDPETNVAKYNVTIFDANDNEYNATIVTGSVTNHTFENVPSGIYTGKVKAMNGVGLWSVWSDEEETISDNEPPIVTETPNGTVNLLVVKKSPIIRAWTNEDAICYYNTTSGDFEFSYTNTTYHETKILNLIDGTYSYKITCIDPASNSGEGIIDFVIDSTKTPEAPSGFGTIYAYENQMTSFTMNLVNGSDNLAGLTPDQFEFNYDDDENEFTVFDKGNGYYNLSFIAPDPGYYVSVNIQVNKDTASVERIVDMNITKLFITALFEDSGITPLNTQHITADSVTDGKIGLASNTPNPNIGNTANRLNITNIKLEDELFIFNTKSNIKTNNIENILAEQNFLSLINPSFGYKIDDKYIINFILRYDNFAITSEIGSTLRRGQYNTLVRNTLTSSGDRILKFTRSDSDSGRIVLQD